MSADTVAVFGATGAVGRELLAILAERGHAPERVLAVASARSAGQRVDYGAESLVVHAPDVDRLTRSDLVFLAAGRDVAREWAPRLVCAGARVVDNSSAFRRDGDVPLIVPEVNGDALAAGDARLVANPNCSTILLVLALEPLRRAFGLERVIVTTYQAVSGAGARAMEELRDQTRLALAGRSLPPRIFPEPCAFNVFPHESAVDPVSGSNEEEHKLLRETRRIWGDGAPGLVPTCARVPVLRSHAEAIVATLSTPAREADVRAALAAGPGLRLVDDRAAGRFPTSLRASGGDDVLVGRVRTAADETPDAEGRVRGFCLWLCADQLRRGAATNALGIADLMMRFAPTKR